MEWQQTIAEFDFLGGSSIEDLQVSCDAIPHIGGVYILKRISQAPVQFLPVSPGGRFKGREPTVAVSQLEELWISSADVVYIGKGDGRTKRSSLRSRIWLYMQFGLGKACAHSGGRHIWQLTDAKALRVFWAATPNEDPKSAESRLIDAFCRSYSQLPFANLRRERSVSALPRALPANGA
jgi:hypothetical protein